MHLHVQLHKSVHMSGAHCHLRAFFTSGCAFEYLTVQYYIEYSSIVCLFQVQMSGSKCKSDGGIPGITTLFIVLYHSFKNVLFLCLVMYYLFDKYYKLITVQCYIADCVSWVPRLTSLNSQTIRT